MYTILLQRYWREIAIAVLIALLASTIYIKNVQIKSAKADTAQAKAELSQYKYALNFQNQAIEAQRVDAEKAKALPKVIEKIKTRYIAVYTNINEIKDNNATTLFNQLDNFAY